MSPAVHHALKKLADALALNEAEAEAAVASILAGEASEAETAAFLTALRLKGETEVELSGAVLAVRSKMVTAGLVLPDIPLTDTCGTGGDGANTVNVSSAAALVVAACGVPVAKHGNRSASGNSGSAEVFAELGIKIDAGPAVVSRCLATLGITFLFAPQYHPGLKGVAPVRKALPFRTLFNLVGPLANPARPRFQLVGVSGSHQAALVAGALARLGVERAAVVTGEDGLDEVSLAAPTRVLFVTGNQIQGGTWNPRDFGMGRVPVAELHVSGPAESASRISHALGGEPGPVRDVILANAAAALHVVRQLPLKAAVQAAAQTLDGGAALRLLQRWRQESRAS